jgi:hypothetical protein
MFNKIYLKVSNLQRHLEAPLVKEREWFVTLLASNGYCVRYQQMVAENLLYTVHYLGLTDGNRSPVALNSIWEMGQSYHRVRLSNEKRKNHAPNVNTKYKDLICNAVKWLGSIDMLDALFYDTECILNKVMTKCFYKVKYLGFPLLSERMSLLQYMYDNGYSLTSVREAAEMQITIQYTSVFIINATLAALAFFLPLIY